MALQRFLSDVDRTRRVAGWVFLAVGFTLLAALAWAIKDSLRFNITTLVCLAVIGGLIALGLRFALRHEIVIEVDLDQRKFNVIRNGTKSASGSLDSLGPLSVKMRTRVTGTENHRRTVTEYVVSAATHSKVDLFVMSTPGKARQKMEVLARAWRLPCQSYGGTVRAADALDMPLHQRLQGDAEATSKASLHPDWHVRIEALTPGYAIVSSHRSWEPLKQSALFLAVLLFVLGGGFEANVLSMLRDSAGDLLAQTLLGLMGVVFLAFLWVLWTGVRDTFYPGTVRVTERGVSYRGRRLALDRIEEVIVGLPIELVGDRRILRLAPSFCPKAAIGVVGHELQRLIIEVGARSPNGA